MNENKLHKTTILDRFKRAVEAFRGKPFSTLKMGLSIKRCDDCEKESVVHCGECGYYSYAKDTEFIGYCGECGKHMGYVTESLILRDPWDFCSKGRRTTRSED